MNPDDDASIKDEYKETFRALGQLVVEMCNLALTEPGEGQHLDPDILVGVAVMPIVTAAKRNDRWARWMEKTNNSAREVGEDPTDQTRLDDGIIRAVPVPEWFR